MATQKNSTIAIKYSDYVPIIKDGTISYGGSQMWFPNDRQFSKDYIIHNYGCGTIAIADLFLYLAINHDAYRNPITEAVLQGTDSANHTEYMDYVRKIDGYYTKTKRWLAVLGPKAATAINDYSRMFGLQLKATWRLSLTYYDMLEAMEDMLSHDLPVILAIGPNTPKLWGKKGINFYQMEAEVPGKTAKGETTAPVARAEDTAQAKDTPPAESTEDISPAASTEDIAPAASTEDIAPAASTEAKDTALAAKVRTYPTYKPVKQDIHGHYVTVTGILKNAATAKIMLRISSWGKKYYINYEEYRDYIGDLSGTYTSSIIDVRRKG